MFGGSVSEATMRPNRRTFDDAEKFCDVTVRARPGRLSALSVSHGKSCCMALLYGRAGRLTAPCRPGQYGGELALVNTQEEYADPPCLATQAKPEPLFRA
jgi:hypothetical protein